MIKFEHNMLVLNNAFSNEDVEQINAFAEYVRSQERDRIIALLTETHAGLKAVLARAHPEGDGSEIIALIQGESK